VQDAICSDTGKLQNRIMMMMMMMMMTIMMMMMPCVTEAAAVVWWGVWRFQHRIISLDHQPWYGRAKSTLKSVISINQSFYTCKYYNYNHLRLCINLKLHKFEK